jgi:glycerate 2-kinase
VPLLLQAPLLRLPRNPHRNALGLLSQRVAEQTRQALHCGIPIGELGAMTLRHYPEHSGAADATAQTEVQQLSLLRGKHPRPVHVEQDGDPRVHLVDILTAWAAAAGGGEVQLVVGYLQVFKHMYHGLTMIFPAADDSALHIGSSPDADAPGFLSLLFDAMVSAADPARLLPTRLPDPPGGKTVIIAAGKAAASMAKTVEDHWPGELSGVAVTRYGHGLGCWRIEVIEAGHPLPDSACTLAAQRVLALIDGLTADDLVLVLLSGGGSSLLTLPAPGLTLADVREVNEQLLRSGAPIGEINCVRKHLSALTGGRLAAAAWPAEVVTFAISDVPGDDPAVIASGPTVGDPSTFADALEIAERYALRLPPAVRHHLEEALDETPKPGDPRLERGHLVLVATPGSALRAAAAAAQAAGIDPVVLGAEVQGEARTVAAQHAALVSSLRAQRAAAAAPEARPVPLLILSGGETTVTVRGSGRGGRNTEYLLALAIALEVQGQGAVYALAADTDGIDGTEDNAGAALYPDSLARARAAGLHPEAFLAANDSYGFFAALGDLLITGPTRTNVNDFRAILAL